jgi:hypothetical protein
MQAIFELLPSPSVTFRYSPCNQGFVFYLIKFVVTLTKLMR